MKFEVKNRWFDHLVGIRQKLRLAADQLQPGVVQLNRRVELCAKGSHGVEGAEHPGRAIHCWEPQGTSTVRLLPDRPRLVDRVGVVVLFCPDGELVEDCPTDGGHLHQNAVFFCPSVLLDPGGDTGGALVTPLDGLVLGFLGEGAVEELEEFGPLHGEVEAALDVVEADGVVQEFDVLLQVLGDGGLHGVDVQLVRVRDSRHVVRVETIRTEGSVA